MTCQNPVLKRVIQCLKMYKIYTNFNLKFQIESTLVKQFAAESSEYIVKTGQGK